MIFCVYKIFRAFDFIQEEETAGVYCMGQLSINIGDRLYFYTGDNFLNKVRYSIKHVLPEITLKPKNNSILIAGIKSLVSVNISMGTHVTDQVSYAYML